DLKRGGAGDVKRGDIVLLRTDWTDTMYGRWPDYFTQSPYFPPESAQWLVDRGPKNIGFDFFEEYCARLPDFTSEDFPMHRVILGAGVVIMEGLTNLGALPRRRVEFAAPFYKIAGMEAVAGIRIDHDVDVLVAAGLHQVDHLLGVVGRGPRVLAPVEAEERDLDVLGHVEAGDLARGPLVRPRGRAVPRHRRLHVRVRRRDLIGGAPAPAPARHADAVGAHARTALRPVHRGRRVAERLLPRMSEHDLQHV